MNENCHLFLCSVSNEKVKFLSFNVGGQLHILHSNPNYDVCLQINGVRIRKNKLRSWELVSAGTLLKLCVCGQQ